MALKIRRGLEADRTSVTPEEGEFLYVTDTGLLYIGDGSTAGGNPVGGGGGVETYANFAAFPGTGETGILYIAEDTGFAYYWDGAAYQQAGGGGSFVESVTGDGVDNTDPLNPVLTFPDASEVVFTPYSTIAATNVQNAIQEVLDESVAANAAITGATKTKITYDSKGLVTSGADATTADIADSTDKRYVTDAQLVVIGNTSGTNSGNETTSTLGTTINGATAATPNDTDLVATVESSVVKKITWTNVKAFLKTYFDTLYQAILVSGTNIKTINGNSVLGSGDLTIASGTGDVVGPSSATNNAIPLFDGTTGKLIKNSTILPTTVGTSIVNLTNPSAVTFIRINADNTVTARSAANMLSDLGGAGLASPAFTGNPTAPTQTLNNNSTRLATTAFVQQQIAAGANVSSVGARLYLFNAY